MNTVLNVLSSEDKVLDDSSVTIDIPEMRKTTSIRKVFLGSKLYIAVPLT